MAADKTYDGGALDGIREAFMYAFPVWAAGEQLQNGEPVTGLDRAVHPRGT